MKRKHFLIGFFLLGAISMLIMSLHYFTQEDAGILKGKIIKDTLWYQICFYIHIALGLIAILVGPFQFLDWIIRKTNIHRKIGYLYVLAVGISSMTGLVIAQFAMGGIITRIGFSTLSILWLYSLIQAMRKVLSGDINAHQKWMRINYAFTFSSITQRLILLFAFIPSFSFMPVYQTSSWLSWMLNLGIVLYFINKNRI